MEYRVPVAPGMVVLDALHHVQAHLAPDLAVRWNCKAGKCGSCSAEMNGRPRLTCKTRMDSLPLDSPVTVAPMKAFPVINDLVTDVSWNYEVNRKIPPFSPRGRHGLEDVAGGRRPGAGVPQVHRVLPLPGRLPRPARSRPQGGFWRAALLRPGRGTGNAPARRLVAHEAPEGGRSASGYCNITKCCTEVCPEDIHITDNAIIPLKERVVDDFYDPIAKLIHKVFHS